MTVSWAIKGGFSLLALLLCMGWMQDLHPIFDSPTHFRLHFVALLLALSLILLLLGAWRWFLAGGAIALISIALTTPFLPSLNSVAAHSLNAPLPSGQKPLRLVQLNIHYLNDTPQRTATIISSANPDVVILQEITLRNDTLLQELEADLPHQIVCHRQGVGSVGILSKHPFVDPNQNLCLRHLGFAKARIGFRDKELTVASFHSRWPWPFSQRRQIGFLKEEFKALQHPLIVAGDFNAAPWSSAVQRVAKLTRTHLPEHLLFTWSSHFAPLKNTIGPVLPIDQTMASQQVEFVDRRLLPEAGSDHLPVLSDVIIR